MSKAFFFASVLSLVVVSANADLDPAMLQRYHWGDYKFTGNRTKKAVGNYNIDNKQRTVNGTDAQGKYRMQWDTDGADYSLAVTESRVIDIGKDMQKVDARTSTFSGDKLRSSTICYGTSIKKNVIGKDVRDTDMKCLTATKESCGRLLEAYEAEAKKQGSQVADMEKVKESAQKCFSTYKSYEKMAMAFGNQPTEIVFADTYRLKGFVDKSTGSGVFDPTALKNGTKDGKMDDFAKNFSTSLNGIETLTTVLQLCVNAKNDFGSAAKAATAPGNVNSGGEVGHH